MIATNYTNARDNLKRYCDMAVNDCETVIVTRKNDENVVIMSEAEYNNLMENMYLRRSAENHRLLLEAMQDDTASVSRTLEELDALADG